MFKVVSVYNYIITFYNKEQKEWWSHDVAHATFSEAVMSANISKNKMGFAWEIYCVTRSGQGITN
jgi:hypothetical protein